MLFRPNPGNTCFACGGANARGMQLTFEGNDETRRVRGVFAIGAEYEGGPGFVHGGIIATVLDEVMAKISHFERERTVTAELSIEYLKLVPVDEALVVEGWEVERSGRSRLRQGEIRDESGTVLARGKGRFVVLRSPVAETA